MDRINNDIKRIFLVFVAACIAVASLCAASPGNGGNTHATTPEVKNLSVKVYPEMFLVFGFSDKHPAAGADYLEPFTGGSLVSDSTGENMVGTFYLYHVSTPDQVGYKIELSATALKLDGASEYAGYNIIIDNQYSAFSSNGQNGPWIEGIPGDAATHNIALGNSGNTVMLSDDTRFDNIWYRTLYIQVPAHLLTDDRKASGMTWDQIAKESWTGTITATLTVNEGTKP